MKTLNRVFMIGHLAADPEVRQTKNGHKMAIFPLATNRMALNEEGNKSEIVDFHRVVAWKGLADVCESHLAKGSAVMVEGCIINRSFDDVEGNKRFKTEINLENINILTWKKNSQEKVSK